jgi:hypothetical protein
VKCPHGIQLGQKDARRMSDAEKRKRTSTHTVVLTNEEVEVLLRGLTFALDVRKDTYFAFYPDADDYSDGDQE